MKEIEEAEKKAKLEKEKLEKEEVRQKIQWNNVREKLIYCFLGCP